jgi:hypothetical protein
VQAQADGPRLAELERTWEHRSGLVGFLFTTHGSTMMFLFAVPVMQALGIYSVPRWSAPGTSRSRGCSRIHISVI